LLLSCIENDASDRKNSHAQADDFLKAVDLVCHMLRPHRLVRLTLDYKSRKTCDSLEFELVGQNVRYLCGTMGGAAGVG